MAGKAKLKARDAFEANLADAEKLVSLVRAFENRRVYRMRQERRDRVGEALDVRRADRDALDWIVGDDLVVIFVPGSSYGRDDFAEAELRPLLRQALVAACAAVETFAADRAKERLSTTLKVSPIPARLADLAMTVADWLAIEERYERRRWGLREIIEAEFDKMASGSPSEIGKLMSAVGVKALWSLVDQHRKVSKGRSEADLARIVDRRNRIAHTGDRAGRGRAEITLGEVEADLACVRSIVEALDAVTVP
jgi:hypothetical protein